MVPAGGELVDDVPQPGAGGGVEAGGRLVEEQHRRRADEAGGQVDPPAGSARQLADPPAGEVVEVEPVDELAGPAAGVRSEPGEAADQLEVLASGEELVEAGVLAGDADAAAHLVGVGDDVEPVDRHPPGRGPHEGGEDPDEGGLAGAVVAEHARAWSLGRPRGRRRRAPRSSRRRRGGPRRPRLRWASCVMLRTPRRRSTRCPRPRRHRSTAGGGAGVLGGVVGQDGVELPAAQGDVGGVDPHLVLHGVAAAVGLGERVAPCRRPRSAGRRRRRHRWTATSTPRWFSGDAAAGVLEQDELERRVGDLEVGVPGALLGRAHPEQVGVEAGGGLAGR